MNINNKSKYVIISEILFILLPIIIIIVFNLLTENRFNIFHRSEWIFAAIVFWGQSIVKFISGLIKSQKKFKWQNIGFIITLIIILGLIPSTIILLLILQLDKPNTLLSIIQFIIFLISIIVYYCFGIISQNYTDYEEKK